MPEPAASSSETAESVERVERPGPGLARGRWEAPAWAFYVTLAAAIAVGIAWLALALRTRRSSR